MRTEISIYLCCRYVVESTGLYSELWAVDTSGAVQVLSEGSGKKTGWGIAIELASRLDLNKFPYPV